MYHRIASFIALVHFFVVRGRHAQTRKSNANETVLPPRNNWTFMLHAAHTLSRRAGQKRHRDHNSSFRTTSSRTSLADHDSSFRVQVAKISGVQFGLLSPHVLRKIAVPIVTKPATSQRAAADAGINSRELGTNSRHMDCLRCEDGIQDCIGHFGYIECALPLVNPDFWRYIVRLVRCVCYYCSKLLLRPHHKQYEYIKGLPGGHCGGQKLQELVKVSTRIAQCEIEDVDCIKTSAMPSAKPLSTPSATHLAKPRPHGTL